MKLLERLRGILGRADAGSAELRAAVSAIDVAPLEEAVKAAERKRTGLLLDGTEAALDKADDVLKLAIRERDRAIAARAELSKRLADAEMREASDALDAERAAVEKEAAAVAKMLGEKWLKMQGEMVALLERLGDAENAVSELNQRLSSIGRSDLVKSVEERAFPVSPALYAPLYSIRRQTALMPLPGAPGWNSGVDGASGGAGFTDGRVAAL
ncbi:hypothetical protein [Rhizobium laguerreae]|uniref:hypothetical protein n=1 Tax=Rhizobium laguerreae TaxID=1076926 RepID=UPI001C90D0BD|nr:hypothetical protein [Rhizobium laguerreae]MBY3347304.1 hypothetical protein [Rhizobium laguerreae]MBY3354428.1 hypothetical protein [Rhizobium laguerreae]MBY3375311.1 hypothetical protein [Rhizobium laguerreae]MBY3430541.1 hypothetical protein [Rhizobium laguerreae]MBY3439188.1 hypothetical protein [Rhizobium laguerreae]